MRTDLIILLLLILVVSIAWISGNAVESFCTAMLDTLTEARESIMAEDWDVARQKTDSVQQSLAMSRSWITMLINQRMLNDIEVITERMIVSVELEEKTAALTELVSLKNYLEEIRSDTLVTLTNLL
ncbi:MAG: DUF4363 family protein [Peptococcaceae bacterium]|jgi:hypothetical protein|nr:DUF4363 family protein [Peptococcaceae bacterium]MDR2736865.1 DUF4363 family protein [Gracilibacteraceae bacterium]